MYLLYTINPSSFKRISEDLRLVFGKVDDRDSHYGDTDVVIRFIEDLERHLNDNVLIKILKNVSVSIKLNNPDIKRIPVLVEEIERGWYCRNIIPEFPFGKIVAESKKELN